MDVQTLGGAAFWRGSRAAVAMEYDVERLMHLFLIIVVAAIVGLALLIFVALFIAAAVTGTSVAGIVNARANRRRRIAPPHGAQALSGRAIGGEAPGSETAQRASVVGYALTLLGALLAIASLLRATASMAHPLFIASVIAVVCGVACLVPATAVHGWVSKSNRGFAWAAIAMAILLVLVCAPLHWVLSRVMGPMPVVQVSGGVDQIAADYSRDWDAAQAKYGGRKRVCFEGVVVSVRQTGPQARGSGRPVDYAIVDIRSQTAAGVIAVCEASPEQCSAATGLAPGSLVEVEGQCSGLHPSPIEHGASAVSLNACEFRVAGGVR